MFSSEASCSDCRIEFIRNKWSKLLLNWINKCIHEKGKGKREKSLNLKCLTDIVAKYKDDVCEDEFDKAMLCTDDIEPFIMYKYPILRLRFLSEDQDMPKKVFIMTSILLFYCCVKSRSGVVHEDIYSQLKKHEQELVLKYCEKLSDMEITISNVEVAIQEAFKCIAKQHEKPSPDPSLNVLEGQKSSDTAAQMSISSTVKSSLASLPLDNVDESAVTVQMKLPPSKTMSEVKALSPSPPDTSKYSETVVISEAVAAQQCISDDFKQTDNDLDKTKSNKKDSKRDIQKYEVENTKSPKDFERKRQNDVDTMISRQLVFEKRDIIVTQNQPQNEPAIYKKETVMNKGKNPDDSINPRCLSECSCTRCDTAGPCCGDPGSTMRECECDLGDQKPSRSEMYKLARLRMNRKITAFLVAIVLFFTLVAALMTIVPLVKGKTKRTKAFVDTMRIVEKRQARPYQLNSWECTNNLCQKLNRPTNKQTYLSHSRCTLICSGPQIWPHPIGRTEYSTKIITLATNKLEYKLKTVSSENLQQYLAEAFKLFIGDLAKLERTGLHFKTKTPDLNVMKMNIQIDVESDLDPRIRVNTEESYQLNLETIDNQIVIKISSASFCGVRHGLETLTQMILLDESTGYLITVSSASIKDAPSYKYRGLMIDTGRNYIPVGDLLRTVDAMATVKLNTFHWRISDVTSFPLYLSKLPQLFEHGAYDRSMIYTKDDVETIVKRAGVRGIRVLIEVAAPGPVGRPWLWSPGKSCPSKNNNTCDNVLCTILEPQDSVLDVLQDLYEEILNMTQVDDIFHLSHGIFSLSKCYNLMNHRDGFLDKALDSLKRANKGFLPKLPIIWYTPQLSKDSESKTWERFGVQLNEWKLNPSERFLEKFKVIHSTKWGLSCEIKNYRCKKYRNWQEMYSWKSWRNLGAFTVEGGEATLWTDLVDSGNLDYHLWPRTAAVAERLWSDIVVNATADGPVYVRLNYHRSRMLHVGVKPQAIWPAWCTSNPGPCLKKVQ